MKARSALPKLAPWFFSRYGDRVCLELSEATRQQLDLARRIREPRELDQHRVRAGVEIGVASTKAFTTQLVALWAGLFPEKMLRGETQRGAWYGFDARRPGGRRR